VEDRVAVLKIVHPGRLPVATERLLQRLPGRRGAEACVAVEVVRAKATACNERQRVVVLEEELAARVKAERTCTLRRKQLPRPFDDEIHRLVPARLAQLAVPSHERAEQSVGRVVGLPTVQPLGAETPMIDAIDAPAADAHDPPTAHADVESAAV
jgi:hypothetical protein